MVEAATFQTLHDFILPRIIDPIRFGQDADIEQAMNTLAPAVPMTKQDEGIGLTIRQAIGSAGPAVDIAQPEVARIRGCV